MKRLEFDWTNHQKEFENIKNFRLEKQEEGLKSVEIEKLIETNFYQKSIFYKNICLVKEEITERIFLVLTNTLQSSLNKMIYSFNKDSKKVKIISKIDGLEKYDVDYYIVNTELSILAEINLEKYLLIPSKENINLYSGFIDKRYVFKTLKKLLKDSWDFFEWEIHNFKEKHIEKVNTSKLESYYVLKSYIYSIEKAYKYNSVFWYELFKNDSLDKINSNYEKSIFEINNQKIVEVEDFEKIKKYIVNVDKLKPHFIKNDILVSINNNLYSINKKEDILLEVNGVFNSYIVEKDNKLFVIEEINTDNQFGNYLFEKIENLKNSIIYLGFEEKFPESNDLKIINNFLNKYYQSKVYEIKHSFNPLEKGYKYILVGNKNINKFKELKINN